MRLRVLLVTLCVGAIVACAQSRAEAHALVRTSEPSDGAQVASPPSEVRVSFTEEPDAKLSSMVVVDASGASRTAGRAVGVPGDAATLRVPLRAGLADGVYTVAWRVISRVDGHLTAGAVVFGVGVQPRQSDRVAAQQPPASRLGVAGRAAMYAGLCLMLGAAWVSTLAFADMPQRVLRLMPLGWSLAAAGLGLLALGQRADAGVAFASLFSASIGRHLILRAIPLAVAGTGVVLLAFRSKASRGLGVALAAAGTAGVMLEHVAAGHAGSGSLAWAKVGAQWLHFAAAGVWVGGLAALLAGLVGEADASRHRAARRFSSVAAFALLAVVATGTARAFNEVGSWKALFGSAFGRLVLVKAVAICGLAALGAVNRYRNTPSRLRALRSVGTAEVAVAAGVLAVTAFLATTPPSTYASVRARPQRIGAAGTDFARNVRVGLTASPGVAGPNVFVVTLTDPSTKRRIEAEGVLLRFTFPARGDVGESELELPPAGEVFRARGTNLSLGGRWRIVALVRRGVDSLEVPIELTTRIDQRRVNVLRTPGQPTLYTVDVGDGRSVQVYLDPGRPGTNDVHATFFEEGRELPIREFSAIAIPPRGDAFGVSARRFGTGHFVAALETRRGRWRFDMIATANDGTNISAQVVIEVKP